MTDPLIGTVIADRYQILQLLGEGGMGRVYAAEHVRMGRKSAVKVMNPGLAFSADAISRFNREAANASRINHPNVAAIYDFGETPDGTLYLAMEFVEGETLRAMIERAGPLSIPRAAAITKQAADALNAAHHLGIVHRDLKPDNVMVTSHPDGGDWVKVVDFGIAKTMQGDGERSSQTVTTAGVSLGTPEYMSPEQLAGEKLDPRTDVYSLGLVLFNMLTGELPYPRLTSKETLVRRLTSRPSSLADVRPEVPWPPRLQRALDRALAPELADRYDNVGEFGRDVVTASAEAPQGGARTVRLAVPSAPPSPTPAARTKGIPPLDPRVRSAPVVPARSSRRPMLLAVVAMAAGFGALAASPMLREQGRQTVLALVDRRGRADAGRDSAVAVLTLPDAALDSLRVIPQAPVPVDIRIVSAAPLPAPAPLSPAQIRAARQEETALRAARARGDSLAARLRADSLRGDSIAAKARDDSIAATLHQDSIPDGRIHVALAEIQGHLARGRQQLESGDLPHARGEYNHAQDEAKLLRTLLPPGPYLQQLGRLMEQSRRDAFQACQIAVADTTNPKVANLHCESFLPKQIRQPGEPPPNPPPPQF